MLSPMALAMRAAGFPSIRAERAPHEFHRTGFAAACPSSKKFMLSPTAKMCLTGAGACAQPAASKRRAAGKPMEGEKQFHFHVEIPARNARHRENCQGRLIAVSCSFQKWNFCASKSGMVKRPGNGVGHRRVWHRECRGEVGVNPNKGVNFRRGRCAGILDKKTPHALTIARDGA